MSAQEAQPERHATFQQINDLKKRIQLIEGEKHAAYQDAEEQKRLQQTTITQLREEVRQLQLQLRDAPVCDEQVIERASDTNRLIGVALLNKTPSDAKFYIKDQIAQIINKFNNAQYQSEQKTKRLDNLQKRVDAVTASKGASKKIQGTEEGKRVRVLENQLEQVHLKTVEAERLKSKYRSIYGHLMQQSASFQPQLASLRDEIKQQEEQIKKLRETHAAAILTRDSVKTQLGKEERSSEAARLQREQLLAELRRQSDEYRAERARQERRSTWSRRDSLSSSERPTAHATTDKPDSLQHLEDIINGLKDATGVIELRDIPDRFQEQKEHNEQLQRLLLDTETQIHKDTLLRDQLQMEGDRLKYSLQKKATGNVLLEHDTETETEKQLEQEKDRKQTANSTTERLCGVLSSVRHALMYIITKIQPKEAEDASNEDVLELSKRVVAASMRLADTLKGVDLDQLDKQMKEDDEYGSEAKTSASLGYPQAASEAAGDTQKVAPLAGVQSSSEGSEQEVLSRASVKRQSQLVSDTRTRRRQYRVPAHKKPPGQPAYFAPNSGF